MFFPNDERRWSQRLSETEIVLKDSLDHKFLQFLSRLIQALHLLQTAEHFPAWALASRLALEKRLMALSRSAQDLRLNAAHSEQLAGQLQCLQIVGASYDSSKDALGGMSRKERMKRSTKPPSS